MHEPAHRPFETLSVGDTASFTVELSPELIDQFAALSGDFNPLHTDNVYAASTRFGGRIPHGMIAGMLFSRLVGMELPGRNCLYLSQTLLFKKPLPSRGNIVVRGEITNISEAARTAKLRTTVHDEASVILVEGEAVTRIL